MTPNTCLEATRFHGGLRPDYFEHLGHGYSSWARAGEIGSLDAPERIAAGSSAPFQSAYFGTLAAPTSTRREQ